MSTLPSEFTNALNANSMSDVAAILRLLDVERPDLGAISDVGRRRMVLAEVYGSARGELLRKIRKAAPQLRTRPMAYTPEVVVTGRADQWLRLLPMIERLHSEGRLDIIPDRAIHLVRDL